MNSEVKQNRKKKHKSRNRNRRVDSQYSSVAPVSLLPVPQYPIPKELLDVLKENRHRYPGISKKGEQWLEFIGLLPLMQDAMQSNYLIILKLLLYLEEYYNNIAMKQYNLYKQFIKRTKYTSGQYIIKVPGLAEDRPSLMPNDIVEILQPPTMKKFSLVVTYVGLDYVTCRPEGSAFHNVYRPECRYDVKFKWPNWPVRVCHYAIGLVDKYRLTPLLYPAVRPVYNKPKTDLNWFDEYIKGNPEQMQAVQRILGRTAYPSPYLVFGPPGTGKTATIVEAISQIWNCDHKNRILVCTPSNSAADEITKRLLNNIPHNLIFRMFSPSRDSKDVDETIHDCTNFIEEEVIFLPRDLLVKKRIIITTLVTCVRLVSMSLPENHFQYIFIDEAGQATQPESLIPIGLTSSEDMGHIGKFQAQIVLSGDPQQLGPVVKTKLGQQLLGKSMLERLMDHFDVYKRNQDGKYDPNFITKLIKNYRSHETILRIPNEIFYDKELVACGGKEINRSLNWSGLPNKSFPLIFHASHGLEKREDHSPSVCNENEVNIVIDYVTKLMKETLGGRKIEQKDIGIVTPFRLQRSVILRNLEKKGFDDIAVGTVEIFQGQEKDVIILSSVRSMIFQHDGRFHIGFLSNEKRFNVAITRAKSLLIVVGNPQVLQLDKCWRKFIEYCKENRACVGDKFTLRDMSYNECKKLLNNRDPTKYKEIITEPIPVNEDEILEERVHPLPENEIPRRNRRLPKIKNDSQTTASTINSTLEVDSGTYSSSNNSVTIEDFVQDTLKNCIPSKDPNRISIDDDSSLSYSDFSSDGEDIFVLAKEITEIDLNAD